MPLIARGSGVDIVNTGHPVCISPGQITTDTCSSNVFVVGFGIHRKDDLNEPHTHCPPVYGTPIVTYSANVYANGKNVARQGDTYDCTAFIEQVTQSTVFAN
jgi:uncharacterized Zn-binding protein involved in type VI secretion